MWRQVMRISICGTCNAFSFVMPRLLWQVTEGELCELARCLVEVLQQLVQQWCRATSVPLATACMLETLGATVAAISPLLPVLSELGTPPAQTTAAVEAAASVNVAETAAAEAIQVNCSFVTTITLLYLILRHYTALVQVTQYYVIVTVPAVSPNVLEFVFSRPSFLASFR